MGFYGEQCFRGSFDKVCGTKASERLRQRVCEGARG